MTKECIRENGFVDLTNTGKWIDRTSVRLRIGGVGDFMEDKQDLRSAVAETGDSETCVLVSHNPDFVEEIRDRRVGLVLSGHTHGGQMFFPGFGAPLVPSAYGERYRYGLVQTEFTQVLISCGIGTISPPVRFCCRPEIVLVTLQ
jgi:predicted MPP superfamily phosphohydrolase